MRALRKDPIKKTDMGYIFALLSALTGSTSSIFMGHLIQRYHTPPILLAFWRDFASALILLIALLLIKPEALRLRRDQWGYAALYGLLFAVFNIVWAYSVANNQAPVATVLVYSSVAFTALLAFVFLGEGLGWLKLVTVGLCFIGCIFVSASGQALSVRVLGLAIGLASGLLYGLTTILGRKAARMAMQPWTTTFYMIAFAALYLLLFNLLPLPWLPGKMQGLEQFFYFGQDWGGWFWLLMVAIFPTVLTFGFYQSSLNLLDASVANLILILEPVFTALISVFVLSQPLRGLQWLGIAVVIASLLAYRLLEAGGSRRRASDPGALKEA